MSRAPRLRFWLAALLALVVHVVLLALAPHWRETAPVHQLSQSKSVHIRILHIPVRHRAAAAKMTVSRQPRRSSRSSRRAAAATPAQAAKPAPAPMHQLAPRRPLAATGTPGPRGPSPATTRPLDTLFPGPALAFDMGGDRGKRPSQRASPAQARVADELAGKLDIPLLFRANSKRARAMAKLARHPEQPAGFRFESVDGEPLLRAVLFESLRQPANRAFVLSLFEQLQSSEVLISLRQRTVLSLDARGRFADAVTVASNKVIVERTIYDQPAGAVPPGLVPLPIPHGIALGIALPDKAADKAKMRDRVRLERLTASPAYQAPLRNRDP